MKYISYLLLIPLLWVLSFFPACWWRQPPENRSGLPQQCAFGRLYWPLGKLWTELPDPIHSVVGWGLIIGSKRQFVFVPVSPPSTFEDDFLCKKGDQTWIGIGQ